MLRPDTSHLDYRALLRRSKRLDTSRCTVARRIAILSDAAVPQLVPLLRVLLAEAGIRGDVYLANYDSAEIEAFDSESGLYRFEPDVAVVLPSVSALRRKYYRDAGDRARFAERVVADVETLWDAVASRSSALILQSNFVLPYERQFGNFDQLVPETFHAQVVRLNLAIAERAGSRTNVLINDVATLAAHVGLKHWFDERLWTLAKSFCALEHLPAVAQNIVDVVLSQTGHVVKCVVTDLDNTLWGGILGDDGLEGIELDPFGHGEPYHRLQHYLRDLKRRGVVLAVCSKNDHDTAIRPFREHPEMVLREEDVAVFVANWGPKPDNIRLIGDTLQIGLDSIVFLDDSPFERQLVRETLPEVLVPELPDDPADYVRVLCELNLFETASYSDEDRRRAEWYRENAVRAQARAAVTDIGEYLASLDMRAAMRPFDAWALPRVAQLIQRSNQFNLTTRRYTLPECEAMMVGDGSVHGFYLTLADKFGDNGLVSVIVLRERPGTLEIDTWLMSCRVLGRGLEQHAMNRVVAMAGERGCEWVTGTYLPTAKNAMVRDFFARFGFEETGPTPDGGTGWRLRVSSYRPQNVHVRETA